MGTVRADNFSDGAGTGAPDFATGIKVSGAIDSSGDAGVATSATAGWLKIEDITLYLEGAGGHGSTNTKIRNFSAAAVKDTTGAHMTFTADATNGADVTINTSGIFDITFVNGNSAGTTVIGISNNSAQLTTNIQTITATDRLAIAGQTTAGPEATMTAHFCGFLSAGDVIRAHTDGSPDQSLVHKSNFRITKLFGT